jgi:hypothetical protein
MENNPECLDDLGPDIEEIDDDSDDDLGINKQTNSRPSPTYIETP